MLKLRRMVNHPKTTFLEWSWTKIMSIILSEVEPDSESDFDHDRYDDDGEPLIDDK